MRTLKILIISILLFMPLIACSSVSTQVPTNAITDTETPALTSTLGVTNTVTATSKPTEKQTALPSLTPRHELTAADVILPIGLEVNSFVYKKCYVNTPTHFHAGDFIYYHLGYNTESYIVYAPMDGWIRFAVKINEKVGWEINVETPFYYDNNIVWYDIVHFDRLIPGIRIDSFVKQGEPIAIVETARDNGRLEVGIDIGIRIGPKGANPQIIPFYPDSYLNVYLFLEDDLMDRNVTYETCEGNPK